MTNSRLAQMDRRYWQRQLAIDNAVAGEIYRAKPGDALSYCVVIVNREVVESDEFGGTIIVANAVEVTAFREHIAARPPLGAQFVVGAEVFTVGKMKKADESRWVALCKV
jgi:hypothetical protein